MYFSGLQKLAMVDWPGKIAATVFTAGCNFRCPFCHNALLVNNESDEKISVEDLVSFLKTRNGLLDGLVISGGEPTIQHDLPDAIRFIKNETLMPIKLDTNGSNPDMIKELINENLIEYIAMDVKTGPIENYEKIIGVSKEISIGYISAVNKSIDYIMSCGIDYEFRTTVIQEFHSDKEIKEIANRLKGSDNYYLQKFVDSGGLIDSCNTYHALSDEKMKELLKIADPSIKHTNLRGVE